MLDALGADGLVLEELLRGAALSDDGIGEDVDGEGGHALLTAARDEMYVLLRPLHGDRIHAPLELEVGILTVLDPVR